MLAIALIAACGGDDDEPTPTAQPTATPRLASTGSDTPAQRDLVDLAARLQARPGLPRQVSLAAPSIGDEQDFALLALGDPPGRRTVHAVLRAISDRASFYVETGSDVPAADDRRHKWDHGAGQIHV